MKKLRLDDPRFVVILGIITLGVFISIFLLSYLNPQNIFNNQNKLFNTSFDYFPNDNQISPNTLPSPTTDNTSQYNLKNPSSSSPNLTPIPSEKKLNVIFLTESDLNELIQSGAKENSNFSNPHIDLIGSKMHISLLLNKPIKGNVSAEAEVSANNNQIEVKLSNAKIGNIQVPRFLVTTLENQINSSINKALGSISLAEIENIYIENEKLIIES